MRLAVPTHFMHHVVTFVSPFVTKGIHICTTDKIKLKDLDSKKCVYYDLKITLKPSQTSSSF